MPIISSGTFRLSAGSVILGGAWQLAGGATTPEEVVDQVVGQLQQVHSDIHECPPGTEVFNGIQPGLYSVEVIPDPDFMLDGVTPANINTLPAGFEASSIQIHWLATLSTGIQANDSWQDFEFTWDGNTIWPDWTPSDLSIAMPLAPTTLPGTNLNAFSGRWKIAFTLTKGASTAGFGCGPFDFVGASADFHAFYATGTYDIWQYWWTIPEVTPCGDRQDSRYQLSSDMPTDPAGPWERLDPDDPNAFPQPVIEAIEANFGPVEGGNEVTIRGSGFGDGCDVTFDGVSASDIVVVSQAEITCVVPPHAAAAVVVIVINPDGVTS